MYAVVNLVLVLCAALSASSYSLGSNDVVMHLYTRTNPSVSEPLLGNVASVITSSFSLTRRTIITIHSNGESVGGNFNAFLVPAHLSAEDVNIIAVDWSPGSSHYTFGLANAPQAAERIAEFVNILIHNFGYNAGLVRIVGVGLGGHIAGIAARNIDGTVPHIVALDPSLTGWTHHPDILNPNDATVVEVLYTTAGILGYDYPLGDLNFYANGGTYQTGCGIDTNCGHIYSYVFYAESVTRDVNGGNTFTGTRCDSFEQAATLQCSGNRDVVFGGTSVKTSQDSSGIYIFLTNLLPPFATG